MARDLREDVTFRTFRDRVPDINHIYAAQHTLSSFASIPSPRFFSIHERYNADFPKVVYLLRDPRDVMISFYHYRHTRERSYSGSLQEFLRSDDHYPCRWDEHVAGWLLDGVKANVCLIRYEEMQRETSAALRRVLDFAEVRCTDAELERAVEASRFEQMRSAEEQYKSPPVADSNGIFVRRGKVGGYADELEVENIRIIEEKYGTVMRIVGYEPSC
jgi:Sulfotransferase domain